MHQLVLCKDEIVICLQVHLLCIVGPGTSAAPTIASWWSDTWILTGEYYTRGIGYVLLIQMEEDSGPVVCQSLMLVTLWNRVKTAGKLFKLWVTVESHSHFSSKQSQVYFKNRKFQKEKLRERKSIQCLQLSKLQGVDTETSCRE